MEAAAERERQAAIAEGRVKDGIAIIDVYAVDVGVLSLMEIVIKLCLALQ